MSPSLLSQMQNPDGGWPYRRGASWTEPTAYAVLAMLAAGDTERAGRGIRWLLNIRRPDGGWPVCADLDESAWPTAIVAMLPPESLGDEAHRGAVAWLLGETGEESTWAYRLREFLSGRKPPPDQSAPGWPWLPGAAAWVAPTSLALLALERELRRREGDSRIRRRLDEGRHFLLNRTCRTGGWNHGSVNALGYPADAYPETTGMALAALRGYRAGQVDRSVALARGFLESCRSAHAFNWLRLGLAAHDSLPSGYAPARQFEFRTVPDVAVDALISAGGL